MESFRLFGMSSSDSAHVPPWSRFVMFRKHISCRFLYRCDPPALCISSGLQDGTPLTPVVLTQIRNTTRVLSQDPNRTGSSEVSFIRPYENHNTIDPGFAHTSLRMMYHIYTSASSTFERRLSW